MAPGSSRFCYSPYHSPHWNTRPTNPMEDKLARDLGPVGDPYSRSTSLAPSRNPTLGLNQVPALIPAPAPTRTPTPALIKELFKKFMKAYLESNQGPRQPPAERKQLLKAKVPEVHMDCYHICQQCEDYFETVEATGTNRTPFAASFLCKNISVRWTQYKYCHRGEELIPIS